MKRSRCWPFIHKSPEMNSAKGRNNDQTELQTYSHNVFNYWRFSIWIAENSLNRFIWKWAYILPSKGFYRRANAQLSQLFDGYRKPAFSSRNIYFNEIEFHPLFLAFVWCVYVRRVRTLVYAILLSVFVWLHKCCICRIYICFGIYRFSMENIQPSPTSYVECSISATDIAVLKSNIICIFWVVITPSSSSYTLKGKQTTQIRLTTHQQNETNSTPPP